MAAVTRQDLPQTGAGPTVKAPAHQQVYEQLRDLILFGDLVPGQAVTIQGIVATLDAGMTPVREGLRRLIAEGALLHQGNRRVIVPELTVTSVDELDFLRKSLEPELTKRATTRLGSDQITQLEAVDAELNRAIAGGDVGGYLARNYQFHALIYHAADAPIMASTVEQLWLRFGPSLRVICGQFGTLNLPDRHVDILKALRAGDPQAAADAMSEDVHQGMLQIAAAVKG